MQQSQEKLIKNIIKIKLNECILFKIKINKTIKFPLLHSYHLACLDFNLKSIKFLLDFNNPEMDLKPFKKSTSILYDMANILVKMDILSEDIQYLKEITNTDNKYELLSVL